MTSDLFSSSPVYEVRYQPGTTQGTNRKWCRQTLPKSQFRGTWSHVIMCLCTTQVFFVCLEWTSIVAGSTLRVQSVYQPFQHLPVFIHTLTTICVQSIFLCVSGDSRISRARSLGRRNYAVLHSSSVLTFGISRTHATSM